MDSGATKILPTILTRRELDKINNECAKKIEKYFEEKFDEFITAQAIHESAQRENGKKFHTYEKTIQELQIKIQDNDVKLDASQQNTVELRKQLDATRIDLNRYQQTITKFETENIELKRLRDNLTSERDSFQSTLESRCTEIDRLKSELREIEKQLKSAINAKYDAISRYDEIQAKEASLEYKERRMEQDRTILQSQLQSITESYNSNLEELMALRRDNHQNRLDLETKLNEKIEELNIVNSTIAHLQETNQSLLNRIDELSVKRKEEADEAVKMIDCYKNELLAKTKLADIYKGESENNKAHVTQLTQAITDLKKMLQDSVSEYGELETKFKESALKHVQELEEKDSIIDTLKNELKNANDLLKAAQDENLEQVVERIAPSAAVTTKLIKTGMTLTEIYSLYVKTAESLRTQERENSKLQIQIKEILKEIEERAPEIDKRNIEYDKLVEANAQIREQLDNMITERVIEREQLQETTAKYSFLERENKRIKMAQSDLARQVCFLLKEIEQTRGGIVSDNGDQTVSADMSAGEVITKKLVTFKSVDELHENNQKLLLLVRDLSTKLEELEENQANFDQSLYKSKIEEYSKRVENMELNQRHQNQILQSYIQQRDRYKLLYYEIMKDVGKPVLGLSMDGSLNADNMEGVDEETPLASSSSVSSGGGVVGGTTTATSPSKDKRFVELQDKLTEANKSMQKLKEEYDEYRKQKNANEQVLNEQFNALRDDVRELTTTNCQFKNKLEYKCEQIKNHEKNVATLKKQISVLEERNKAYDSNIVKHEQTILYLREKLMQNQKQLSGLEVANKNLKHQFDVVRDSENRLQSEREAFYRERQTQNLVLNNLEMLKNHLERSENEGRQRIEQRLDESVRETSALRRHLQEEQDRFRELSIDLERKTNAAIERADREKAEVERLQNEMKDLRAELSEKIALNESLSEKLQEALTPNKSDNPVAKANKRAKELQHKLDLTTVECDHLKKELETTQSTIEQYKKIAKESEDQLKDLSDRYTEYRTKAEDELQKLKTSETTLLSRVAELETEIKLQITDAQLNNTDSTEQLTKAQHELKDAYEKIRENNVSIRDLRDQVNQLTSELKITNDKYTQAIQMHTNDLQSSTACKDKLSKIQDDIAKLTHERDQAISELKEKCENFEIMQNLLAKEKAELEKRIEDMNSQNTILHNELQSLSTTVATIRANDSISDGTNASATEQSPNESILNRSINDEDGREKLMTIIKYLRSEKDIAFANVDVLRNENIRINCEIKILREKIQELSRSKESSDAKQEENPLTTSKYQEVLRKLETLNAITDSNRMLREERDQLQQRIKEITERNEKLEVDMFPLQEKNRELLSKTEEQSAEIAKIRTEALQWRQRANALVERSNKNPEDFKRLQIERENLAKMLTAEKEKITQLESDLTSLRQEKVKLETDIATWTKNNQTLTEEKRKLAEDLNALKQTNGRLTHEVIDLKNKVLQRDDEVKRLVDELQSKEALLVDSRNKEIQIRKIAKKYKDSYFETQKQVDELQAKMSALPIEQQAANLGEAGPSREKELNDKIKELDTSVSEKSEENDLLRAENETLKKNISEQDKGHSNVLKELNTKISSLSEEKDTISRELAVTKTSLLNFEASRTEHDNQKVQNEDRIKELADMDKENKETIARLTRENEALQSRLNQLLRQLGLQQGNKPATSSSAIEKSPSDAARTANVKPMAGPNTQQSATVTPRRSVDTPLASIRPMSVQNSRTAAVLPTSQTPNVVSIHGTSSSSSPSTPSASTASVTALVPPQQVHTTGMQGEVMSTTSSHTDYMPATSSAASVVVAAVTPMSSGSQENVQGAESVEDTSSSSSSAQVLVQPQAVAMVSPRQHENAPQNIVAPQQVIEHLHAAASTSASSSTSTSGQSQITMSTHNRATSTSNTVTTSQAGHKRPREVEVDLSGEVNTGKPQLKRTRQQIGSSLQGVSESSCADVEYQVPTSSQRDHDEYNIIVVDSDDDDEMPDEGPVEPDDAPFEDDGDNVEQFDMEDPYGQGQDAPYDGEAGNIYGEQMSIGNNEVDVEDSSETPNQSENQSVPSSVDMGTSQVIGQSSSFGAINSEEGNNTESSQPQSQEQQLPTQQPMSQAQQQQEELPSQPQIQGQPQSQQQQEPAQQEPEQEQQQEQEPQQQSLPQQQQQPMGLGYEESGDDSIVPSTPTLYVPRRADGFSEAVSSPHPQVQQAVRFTFAERSSTNTNEQLDASGSEQTPSEVILTTEESRPSETTSSSTSAQNEPIPGTSAGDIPEIAVSDDVEGEFVDDNASTTEDKQGTEDTEEIDEEEGTDGVSSEGEKPSGNESIETEEGREAEATHTPTMNTRSRGQRGSVPMYPRRSRRPQPIIWQDGAHGPMNQDYGMQQQQQQHNSPSRSYMPQSQSPVPMQRGGRNRRIRRPFNRYP